MALAFNQEKHLYTWDGRPVPSVSDVLRIFGHPAPWWFTESAADRGAFIHDCCAAAEQNCLDWSQIDEDTKGHVSAWLSFVQSEVGDISGAVIEEPLYHPIRRYAGTPDRYYPNADMLVDLKTGSPMPTHALQMAAYVELIRARTGSAPKHIALVYTQSDGRYTVKFSKPNKDNFNIFLSGLTVLNWSKANQ